MCGIAGYWRLDAAGDTSVGVDACARGMADRLAHRGPDDQGLWANAEDGLALSHRRLAILDLSVHGRQPMSSPCGRYVGVFNGEIYNFVALKGELEASGVIFRGHCDAEVLFAALGAWGLDAALARFNGMFALAVWDRRERRLHMARDRLGQKPLYYGRVGNAFAFASELKAFRGLPGFAGDIDRDALADYLQMGYVPAPQCLYAGLHKLAPGATLSLDAASAWQPNPAHQARYWSATDLAQQGARTPFAGDDAEALETLDEKLCAAVDQRLLADVPLGAFLSGGIDSSLVVALMQAQSTRPVRTFSVGFGEHGAGETEYAAAVARHLGTEHTELHVTGREAVDTVPRLATIVDEPLADFAQVPNYLVARHAREHITVALTGDGGDEFFCGYSRFTATPRRWQRLRRTPLFARRLLSGIQNHPLCSGAIDRRRWKSALRTGSASIDELYFYQMGHWLPGEPLLARPLRPHPGFTDAAKWPECAEPVQRLMLNDVVYYLADTILPKVDRTSMACGLEVRSPLLDFQVAEWSWRLPLQYKVRDGRGKWLLRELLARYLPRPLFERPKQGFGAPIGRWLTGPLREWAGDLLAPERLRRQGLLNADTVAAEWAAAETGKRHWQKRIWAILMLEAWLECQN